MLQSPWRYTSKEPSGRRTYPVTPSGRTPRVKLYCSSISYAVCVDEFAGRGAAIGGAAVGGVVGGDVKEVPEAMDGEATIVGTKRRGRRRWRLCLAIAGARDTRR